MKNDRILKFRDFSVSLLLAVSVLLSLLSTVNAAVEHRLDINVAKLEDLLILYGIGIEEATAIVTHRSHNGSYEKIEDLIPVIGGEKFELIRHDIVARTPKERFKDALSGRFTLQGGRQTKENSEDDIPRYNGKLDLDIRDIASIYIESTGFDIYKGYVRRKEIYSGKATLNFYRRVLVTNPDSPARNAPRPKVFKVINHQKELEKSKSDIEQFLDDEFGAEPLVGSSSDGKVIGYFGTTDDYLDQLRHPESRRAAMESRPKATTMYDIPRVGQPVLVDLANKPFKPEEPEKLPDQKIRKDLIWRVEAGDISMPEKRRPNVGSSTKGAYVTRYFEDWKASTYWMEDSEKSNVTFGTNMAFDHSRNSNSGLTMYRHHDTLTRNNFDCVAIYGSKRYGSSSITAAYDHMLNKAHGIYSRLATSRGKLNVTTQFNAVKRTYNSLTEIEPYTNAWWYRVADTFEPYLRLIYKWDSKNSVTFQASSLYMDYDSRSGSSFKVSSHRSSNGSLLFSFKPRSDLSYSLYFSKAQSLSGEELMDNHNANIKVSYAQSKNTKWETGFTAYTRQDNSYSYGNRRSFLSLSREFTDKFSTYHRIDVDQWPSGKRNTTSHHRFKWNLNSKDYLEVRQQSIYKRSSSAEYSTDSYMYFTMVSNF